MIDLHLHSTASDGAWTPTELVRRARAAGLRIVSVTDHDTLAGLAEAEAAARACGLELVPGVEVTALSDDADVHILGYFAEWPEALAPFLEAQRADRIARVRAMAAKLAALGFAVDVEPLIRQGAERPGAAVGRPLLARALVEAGYVGSVREAFERWLGRGCPAFVPRHAWSPVAVVRTIRAAGGVAALAHPGLLRRDELLPQLVDAGLGALEVYHSDHDPPTTERYLALARQYDLAVSGGSDCHGEADYRGTLGQVTLPAAEFERLRARILEAARASAPWPPP